MTQVPKGGGGGGSGEEEEGGGKRPQERRHGSDTDSSRTRRMPVASGAAAPRPEFPLVPPCAFFAAEYEYELGCDAESESPLRDKVEDGATSSRAIPAMRAPAPPLSSQPLPAPPAAPFPSQPLLAPSAAPEMENARGGGSGKPCLTKGKAEEAGSRKIPATKGGAAPMSAHPVLAHTAGGSAKPCLKAGLRKIPATEGPAAPISAHPVLAHTELVLGGDPHREQAKIKIEQPKATIEQPKTSINVALGVVGGGGSTRRVVAPCPVSETEQMIGDVVQKHGPAGRGGGGGCPTYKSLQGERFLLLGIPSPVKEEIELKIRQLGGQVLGVADYDKCSHVCVRSATGSDIDGKKLVTMDWLRAQIGDKNTGSISLPSEKINEDEIRGLYHHLFACKKDLSARISVRQYAFQKKGKMQTRTLCPGSNLQHTYTEMEVKVVLRELYLLIKSLHKAGYTLAGAFSADNFVLCNALTHKSVKFGELQEGALQMKTPAGAELDLQQLRLMIRKEIFIEALPPHDINVWLSLLVDAEFQGLVPGHFALLNDEDARDKFLSLYDTFCALKHSRPRPAVYDDLMEALKNYNGWKKVVKSDGNDFLIETTMFKDKTTGEPIDYPDDIDGLLRLLRNSRHHSARDQKNFLAIVASNFPNVVYDFQKAMYRAGYKS